MKPSVEPSDQVSDVTVVVPVYNMADTLIEALASCARQTVPPEEVIVVDDGSTDGSREVARATLAVFGLSGKVISVDHGGSPGRCRNLGVELASGCWIQFLDADDLLHPLKLERQVAVVAGDDVVAYSDYRFFRTEPDGSVRYERRGPRDGVYWPDDPVRQFRLYTVIHRFLFPRRWLVDVDGFDESLTHAEDLDLWLRLLAAGARFVYQPEALAFYREHISHSLSQPIAEATCQLRVARRLRRELWADRDLRTRRRLLALELSCSLASRRARHRPLGGGAT